MEPVGNPEEGWYRDPSDETLLRYWSGERWTEHTSPVPPVYQFDQPYVAESGTFLSRDADRLGYSDRPFGPGDAFGDGFGPVEVRVDGHRSVSTSKRWWAVAGVTACLVAGAGSVRLFAVGSAGGAATPEEAVETLFAAAGNEDLLGMFDVMLPAERDLMRTAAQNVVSELGRLELVDKSTGLDSVPGVDVSVADMSMRVEPVASDVVNVYVNASLSATVKASQLPVGDAVSEAGSTDGAGADTGVSSSTMELSDMRVTTVEQDGRWYVSVGYSAAEALRAESGDPFPGSGVAPVGAPSPEAFVDQAVAALEAQNIEGMLALLHPGEAGVLQRYAPLFAPQAQQELDDAGLTVSVDSIRTSVDVSGDEARVRFEAATIEVASLEGDTYTVVFEDGCVAVASTSSQGTSLETVRPEKHCLTDAGSVPTLVLRRYNGEWFAAPVSTVFDVVFAALRELTPEDVRNGVDGMTAGFEDYLNSAADTLGGEVAGYVMLAPSDPLSDTLPGDLSDVEVGDLSGSYDAYNNCWAASADSAAMLACVESGVASGAIDRSVVGAEFLYPECGMYAWPAEFAELDDAAFTAVIVAGQACFAPLVESGKVALFEVPLGALLPSCFEGRNPYTDPELLDRGFECELVAK